MGSDHGDTGSRGSSDTQGSLAANHGTTAPNVAKAVEPDRSRLLTSQERLCLTCRQPLSKHKGFTCPTPVTSNERAAFDRYFLEYRLRTLRQGYNDQTLTLKGHETWAAAVEPPMWDAWQARGREATVALSQAEAEVARWQNAAVDAQKSVHETSLDERIAVLGSDLAIAVAQDEAPEEGGFDLSAGMFGRHVSAWIRKLAGSPEETEAPLTPHGGELIARAKLCRCGICEACEFAERRAEKALEPHQHTDECWEPDSGCDIGRNAQFVEQAGEPLTAEIRAATSGSEGSQIEDAGRPSSSGKTTARPMTCTCGEVKVWAYTTKIETGTAIHLTEGNPCYQRKSSEKAPTDLAQCSPEFDPDSL